MLTMNQNNARRLLTSALLVVGLGVCLGNARELLEDISYELKYHPEKALRDLQTPKKPRFVAEVLAATRADEEDKIGSFNKTDYLGLLHVEPRDCFREELERRRGLCRAAKLAGLKQYCQYFVGQLEEYCSNTATWRLLKTFIEVKEREKVIYDALEVSMKFDKFLKERTLNDEDVAAFCKDVDRSSRMEMVHVCSRFDWLLEAELKDFSPDESEQTDYLDSFTSMPQGEFAKVARRCKTIVSRCHKPVAALI